jgi:hypothetical protein
MGQGIITVRDGATIVLGDVSSQEGSEARGCGRLGKPKAYRVDRGDQGGRAPQDIGQRRTTTRAVPVSQRGCRTGSLSALCCPGVGLYLYNLRMAGSWADACPQAPAGPSEPFLIERDSAFAPSLGDFLGPLRARLPPQWQGGHAVTVGEAVLRTDRGRSSGTLDCVSFRS